MEVAVLRVEHLLPAAHGCLLAVSDSSALIVTAALMRDQHRDLVVVCDSSGRLAGVVTKSDVVRQISQCAGAGCTTSISAVMSQAVVTCRAGDLLQEAWSVMKERHLKNIPIIDQGFHPIGVLNARDALEAFLEETKHEERLLRDYVTCVGYH